MTPSINARRPYCTPVLSIGRRAKPVAGSLPYTLTSKASPVNATFAEVVENELLVAEERWEGVSGMQDGGVMQMRLEFHDQGDGTTRLVLRQGPYTAEMQKMADMGWESSFTKLDALLAG